MRIEATSSLLLLLALAAAPGCSSDHRALALRPRGGAGGMGGMGGANPGGLGGQGGAITKPDAAGNSGVNPDKHVDTPGRSVFTVVHGVVDAGPMLWCFARVRDGAKNIVGDPVPPGGLAYGTSLSFETLPHVDSEMDGVAPFVITGDLTLLDGLNCTDAVARAADEMAKQPSMPDAQGGQAASGGASGAAGEGGAAGAGAGDEAGGSSAGAAGEPEVPPPTPAEPPALRVGELPALPPGTLAEGLSVIEVADGCFGAAAYTDRYEQLACGFEYTPEHGSLSAEVVVLARDTVTDKLALQALHASRGTTRMGVRSNTLSADGSPLTLVDNFTLGALRPRDPRVDLPSPSWGANLNGWIVEATIDGTVYLKDVWRDVRERAAIEMLEDGRGYTLIAVGPSIELEEKGFWNDFAFALVDNDPPVSP